MKGLTATRWLLIAFMILLAAVIAWEAYHDLVVSQHMMRGPT